MTKKSVHYSDHLGDLIRAYNEDRVLLTSQGINGLPNTMAIGWGTIGIIWRRPIFMVLVRPSRYTYKLIEETGEFTVNILPLKLKEAVQYCGTVSGRDFNKFKEKGLTPIPSTKVTVPIIKEAILHFECQVLHKNDLIPSELAKSIIPQFYPKDDFHRLYYGEILACQVEV